MGTVRPHLLRDDPAVVKIPGPFIAEAEKIIGMIGFGWYKQAETRILNESFKDIVHVVTAVQHIVQGICRQSSHRSSRGLTSARFFIVDKADEVILWDDVAHADQQAADIAAAVVEDPHVEFPAWLVFESGFNGLLLLFRVGRNENISILRASEVGKTNHLVQKGPGRTDA